MKFCVTLLLCAFSASLAFAQDNGDGIHNFTDNEAETMSKMAPEELNLLGRMSSAAQITPLATSPDGLENFRAGIYNYRCFCQVLPQFGGGYCNVLKVSTEPCFCDGLPANTLSCEPL